MNNHNGNIMEDVIKSYVEKEVEMHKISSQIIKIFKKEKKKVAVFIDGPWGVGKSYIVDNEIGKEKNLITLSTFGKSSIQELEKELINKLLLPTLSSGVGKAVNTTLEKLTGLSYNVVHDYFVIDNIPDIFMKSKDYIICFDDLERKSDNYNIKDVLGLIERTAKSFNVIIVSNSQKLSKEDKILFEEYREKVIDVSFWLNRIDVSTYKSVVHSIDGNLSEDLITKVVDVYRKDRIFGISNESRSVSYSTNMQTNLRVFEKFVRLSLKVKMILDDIFLDNFSSIREEEYLEVCKYVIEKDNCQDDEKVVNRLIENQEVCKEIEKILNYDKYSKDVLRDYFRTDNEIRKDIARLRNLHQVCQSDFDKMITSIRVHTEMERLDYFADQTLVITLYGLLLEVDVNVSFSSFMNVAVSLYDVSNFKKPTFYKYEDWRDYDYDGEPIEIHDELIRFIKWLNDKNLIKYRNYVDDILSEAYNRKDVHELNKVLKHKLDLEITQVVDIYEWAYSSYISQYQSEYFKVMDAVTYLGKREEVIEYLRNMVGKEENICEKKVHEYFLTKINYLDELEYRQSCENNIN